MRKFLQNKLWRDTSVELMESQGSRIIWRALSDDEFNKELQRKLLEEAQEVVTAKSKHELISELADLYEVIETLTSLNQIAPLEISLAQEQKRNERGGFLGRKFVEVAEHPQGSFGEAYCLKDPKKYPEIT